MQETEELLRSRVADVTPRQLVVLMALEENGSVSQAALVAHTRVDRSTLSELVRRLHRAGLIRRKRHPSDGRANSLELTEQGRKVVRSAEPIARLVGERVMSALPAARRERFLAALANIVELLGATAPSKPKKLKR
jgi:DNA-binding MarR family transcriptional regulator